MSKFGGIIFWDATMQCATRNHNNDQLRPPARQAFAEHPHKWTQLFLEYIALQGLSSRVGNVHLRKGKTKPRGGDLGRVCVATEGTDSCCRKSLQRATTFPLHRREL